MNEVIVEDQRECEECYKIVCRGCQWEPSDDELRQIQNGDLTVCPRCGWSPGERDS